MLLPLDLDLDSDENLDLEPIDLDRDLDPNLDPDFDLNLDPDLDCLPNDALLSLILDCLPPRDQSADAIDLFPKLRVNLPRPLFLPLKDLPRN